MKQVFVVVVFVFLSSAPGLSPIWPSPPERRVNTGDTPFQSTLHLAGDRTSDLWITTDPLQTSDVDVCSNSRASIRIENREVIKPCLDYLQEQNGHGWQVHNYDMDKSQISPSFDNDGNFNLLL
ncbi:hypothetical protein DPMN_128356 [Dreissena polymorpha]|uniref:Uncharacterized protein n=1 Tax=Dreissena polymorpha TaxID=45954 RepID=A0A9D4H0N2_DREPO|nr:hypothetical protein DPMN_128356 [Dreissena polymorpha]